jgi:hypothetical protein
MCPVAVRAPERLGGVGEAPARDKYVIRRGQLIVTCTPSGAGTCSFDVANSVVCIFVDPLKAPPNHDSFRACDWTDAWHHLGAIGLPMPSDAHSSDFLTNECSGA